MEWGFPVRTGFPSYGREFYIGVCRPGTAFLDGLASRGDTVGMLGHDKLCLIIRRRSRGPRRPPEPPARPQGERRVKFKFPSGSAAFCSPGGHLVNFALRSP